MNLMLFYVVLSAASLAYITSELLRVRGVENSFQLSQYLSLKTTSLEPFRDLCDASLKGRTQLFQTKNLTTFYNRMTNLDKNLKEAHICLMVYLQNSQNVISGNGVGTKRFS